MYILIDTTNNFVIDWNKDTPFTLGDNQIQVVDNFHFEPTVEESQWVYLGDHKFELLAKKDKSILNVDEYLYSDFISIVTSKNKLENIQEQVKELGNYKIYRLTLYDNNKKFITYIDTKNNSSEIIDYETNYQPNVGKSDSLSVNIDSSNILRVTNPPIRYFSDYNEVTIQCNNSSWTEFYNKVFGNEIEISEIILDLRNDHYLKVELDGVGIFEDKVKNIIDMFFQNGNLSDFIRIDSQNLYKISINLRGHRGNNLKIYQKRRDLQDKDITIYGYMLVFTEV